MGDSASREGKRRHRRAQTERWDVHKLLTMRVRHVAGERTGWRVVWVPSVGDADGRQLPRDLLTAKRDRTRGLPRRKGLLAGWGGRLTLPGDGAAPREQGRQWDGSPRPPAWRARLQREWQTGCFLPAPIDRREAARREAGRPREEPAVAQVRQLKA